MRDSEIYTCYPDISFTYERDSGRVTSWLDHILTFRHHSDSITNIKGIHSPDNLSDHIPLSFDIHIRFSMQIPVTMKSSHSTVAWDRVSSDEVQRYRSYILDSLPTLGTDIVECCDANCTLHCTVIDHYCSLLLDCIEEAADCCLPKRSKRSGKVMPGWNDHVKVIRQSAYFWNNVWTECGCPRSGVIFELRNKTKRECKYAIRRAKRRQMHIANEKTWQCSLHQGPWFLLETC